MTRKKKIKLSILEIILVLMVALTYEFLFGKLFPDVELKSPDMFSGKTIVGNNIVESITFIREKN